MGLAPDYLLAGAFFAAEQSWNLLHDAGLLYRHERYASCFVLSTFSIEEIGRSRFYLEQTERALRKEVLTLNDIEFRDHVGKLRKGHSSPVTVFQWGTASVENEAQLFKGIHKIMTRRPVKSHEKRLRAVYVEPVGSDWSKPTSTRADEANDQLFEATSEYTIHRGKLNRMIAESQQFREVASRTTLPDLPEAELLPY